MARLKNILCAICILAAALACEPAVEEPAKAANQAAPASAAGAAAPTPVNVLEIDAVGMRFTGPETIKSGWTTIRLNNRDGMLHFAMVVRLPDGVTATTYSDELGTVFQEGYNLMLEGKGEEAGAVFGGIPEWVYRLSYHGGPGFVSGGMSAESTQYLEPGNYLVECYIKSNGLFHSYSPVPGQLAMLLPLKVEAVPGDMAEPGANATLTIGETGMALTDGALRSGGNSVRVRFESQVRFPSFVGQDVHVVKVESDADVQAALGWMDWQQPGGLLVPSPVTFVGGINDVMPAGSTAYFNVHLEPGRYAFIGEAPDADEKGLLLEFEIQ